MHVRPFREADLPEIIDLTIETFRPFYEDYVRPLSGEEVFRHQHGRWKQDYRDDLPTLSDSDAGRFIAVADVDSAVREFVSWRFGEQPRHGQIYLLAVATSHRGQGLGHALCHRAIDHMKSNGVDVVGIGTCDDHFHAAARTLYEDLGFTKIPVAAYLKGV